MESDSTGADAMEESTELLTAEGLAKLLRVCPETVRLWSRRGMIPSIRVSRKVIRFDAVAVITALKQRNEKGPKNA